MTALYRGMDKQTLDRAYNNVSDEPNYQEIMRSFKSRSAAVYASNSVVRDLSYGKQPRQRFDWIWCGQPNAPKPRFTPLDMQQARPLQISPSEAPK